MAGRKDLVASTLKGVHGDLPAIVAAVSDPLLRKARSACWLELCMRMRGIFLGKMQKEGTNSCRQGKHEIAKLLAIWP